MVKLPNSQNFTDAPFFAEKNVFSLFIAELIFPCPFLGLIQALHTPPRLGKIMQKYTVIDCTMAKREAGVPE